MNEYNIFTNHILFGIILGLIAGICIGFLLIPIISQSNKSISPDTANEICFNLTGIDGTLGNVNTNGKLICETPSFDSTQNIIIKSNKNE